MKRSADDPAQDALSDRHIARVRRPFVAPKMSKPSAAPVQSCQSARTTQPVSIKPKALPGRPDPTRTAKDPSDPAVSSTASAAMQYFTVLYTKRSNKVSRCALDTRHTV